MTSAIGTCALAAGAAALLSAQAAYAAPARALPAVNPLVSLSLLGTAQSRTAVCSAGMSAAAAGAAVAAAAQTVTPPPGCLLPVTAPPPPPATTTYVPPPPPARGLGFNPLFGVLGALLLIGLGVWLLDDDDDDDEIPVSPF